MICQMIDQLVSYGVLQALCAPSDALYVRHRLMALLHVEEWLEPTECLEPPVLGQVQMVLDGLLEYALAQGVLADDGITQKDAFDSALMDCLLPPPSGMQMQFDQRRQESALAATSYYYQQSCASNYVRLARIAKNLTWRYPTVFGDLDITINLSRPEKDPKAIIAEGRRNSGTYPRCLLCRENEGYSGRTDHPARQNLRLMPVRLLDEAWFLQYSPYEYYNEHCIVLKAEHEPMAITALTFERLLDFVAQFPHYFVGSNADLPIVGGSILSHDHFQGGRHAFAMARANVLYDQPARLYRDVRVQMLHWPLSVVRLVGSSAQYVLAVASEVLAAWRAHSDTRLDIVADSQGTPHNTITPIARCRAGVFELDLVLRNNRTSVQHPLGIFHPHEELHHIKKENIGLIEVMGLAVLPERLGAALGQMQACLEQRARFSDFSELSVHAAWFEQLAHAYDGRMNAQYYMQRGVGQVFEEVLNHAGVFKQTDEGQSALRSFLKCVI